MKKTIPVLVGIALMNGAGLLQSCWRCPEGKSTYFDVTSISAKHYYNLQGDLVLIENYQILLEAQASYYSLHSIQANWGGSAFADDCVSAPPGSLGSKENIMRITVTSDAAWDSLHTAGSILNDLIYAEADSYSAKWVDEGMPLDSVNINQLPAVQLMGLRFAKAPVIGKKHIFQIEYEQTNGEKYTATLPAITFQ